MGTLSDLTLRRALSDPQLRESLLVALLMFLASGGFTLWATWACVIRQAMRRVSSPDVDWLVVCGYLLQDGRPSPRYRTRLQRAAGVAEADARVGVMLAGGGRPSEAAVGRDWLLANTGVAPSRIRLEETSRDTFDNLRHARELLPEGIRLGLVTSRFHLARVLVYARHLGLAAQPVPAEPSWRFTPANVFASLRESIFLCWFVSGRFWARLANRRPLLERIC